MSRQQSTTGGQHRFSQVPTAEIQRSQFDRSCGLKTTFSSGWLIPIFCDEALPGDTFNLQMSTFARLATPLHPIMDNMYMDFHFFFVPNRLLWDNWQKFCGEQTDPDDSTDYLTPIMTATSSPGESTGNIADYMGIPISAPDLEFSAFWHRAYTMIWNEWFRDQNLQDSAAVNTDDGPDGPSAYSLLRRGKRHDYFTSCLPWPQKGPSVELPLGTTAPLTLDSQFMATTGIPDAIPSFQIELGTGDHTGITLDTGTSTANANYSATMPASAPVDTGISWDNPGLQTQLDGATGVVDLSTATAATINALRQAFQIQRLYERDARGGTRYTEILRSHFGVVSPDQRLQRPEYLGGGTAQINLNAVPQTSSSDAQPTEQGNLAAYGTSTSSGIGFNKSFVEHGVILGLASVRADLNYQQGLLRMFSRRTRWDYFWPALAHLGEQAVLNKEIYAQGSPDQDIDDQVFGYQERYAEYRYKPSMITGVMRSAAPQSTDTWHLAQHFSSLPELGDVFIQENPPIQRIIAVTSEPEFLFDAYFKYKCARPMPVYSVPGLIDHF